MGNTESKIIDIGMRTLCKITGGMIGKSDDGYHIGPLRVKKNSIGIKYSSGIWNAEFKISKSDRGGWTPKIGFGIGIPGKLELKIQAEKTKEGFNISPSFSVDAGPLHVNGKVTIDQDLTFQKESIEMDGPVNFELKHTKYNKEQAATKVDAGIDQDLTFQKTNIGIAGPVYDEKGTLKHTKDSKKQPATQFKAGIQVGPVKTKIDFKDGLCSDNLLQNLKFDIDSDYIAKKTHEYYKRETCEKEDVKKDEMPVENKIKETNLGESNARTEKDKKEKLNNELMPVKHLSERPKQGESDDNKDNGEKKEVKTDVMRVERERNEDNDDPYFFFRSVLGFVKQSFIG